MRTPEQLASRSFERLLKLHRIRARPPVFFKQRIALTVLSYTKHKFTFILLLDQQNRSEQNPDYAGIVRHNALEQSSVFLQHRSKIVSSFAQILGLLIATPCLEPQGHSTTKAHLRSMQPSFLGGRPKTGRSMGIQGDLAGCVAPG
jgi:hypothetical protein